MRLNVQRSAPQKVQHICSFPKSSYAVQKIKLTPH